MHFVTYVLGARARACVGVFHAHNYVMLHTVSNLIQQKKKHNSLLFFVFQASFGTFGVTEMMHAVTAK